MRKKKNELNEYRREAVDSSSPEKYFSESDESNERGGSLILVRVQVPLEPILIHDIALPSPAATKA